MSTQKVLSTGRYGSRYGIGIRRKLLKVEPLQLAKHQCPSCGSKKAKRKSKGIYHCRKCGNEFVGGSYLPQTLTGSIIAKMVAQKTFAPETIQALEKAHREKHETEEKTEQHDKHEKKE